MFCFIADVGIRNNANSCFLCLALRTNLTSRRTFVRLRVALRFGLPNLHYFSPSQIDHKIKEASHRLASFIL